MLDGILKGLAKIEKIASTIAAVFMFAIMIIVFGDVIMRYAFNKPFSWAYDLISLYLMAGIFFLVLSEAYTDRAHVSVDILQQKFSPAMIRLSEIVTCIVGIVVFSLIAWLGFLRAVDSFLPRSDKKISLTMPWVGDCGRISHNTNLKDPQIAVKRSTVNLWYTQPFTWPARTMDWEM